MSGIQLLVSVRNATEARAAMAGGADIVDVKDPDHGSLGFAGWNTIQDVCSVVADGSSVVSAALGELEEWNDRSEPSEHDDLPVLQYAKIGLANVTHSHDSANLQWEIRWLKVRTSFFNVKRWVAVAYSDFKTCGAPAPNQVLEAAIRSSCQILLFDTFVKDGRTTFDHLSMASLKQLFCRAQEAGLKVAIAGQVTAADVRLIEDVRPDIVAVRGAVCEHQDRKLQVVQGEVERLKEAIQSISEVRSSVANP